MANENKEIGEIVKKCKILLLDIEGTTTSISFVKDELFPYAQANVKQFLESEWERQDVKDAVAALSKQALEDKEKAVEGVVEIPAEDAEKAAQIEGLVGSVKWQMSQDRKSGPLKTLQGLVWKQGYDKGEIKGHLYDDVAPAIELWRSVEGQKVYIYSSGSVEAQKLLFGQSSAGDILHMIDGHFDTAVGAKQEKESYANIVEKIGCKAEEVLFLTDILKEAEAARAAGLYTALVSRDDPVTPTDTSADFPIIRTFAVLAVSNKRKPDAQIEEPAPKVAKTEDEVDPKAATENGSTETKVATESVVEKVDEPVVEKIDEPVVKEKKAEEVEKMEVEDGIEVAAEAKEDTSPVGTVVEDITDKSDTTNLPETKLQPMVTEAKTDDEAKDKLTKTVPETPGSMETEKVEAKPETAVNKDKVATETVITEIEEVTDKVIEAEIVEDIVPVVEEPPAEMEELHNVGEVLEKECDEILSKVQDVTNLDSIPVKPMLSSISEETMETENTDSNDIVDKILDTEIEMGMKQSTETETKAPEPDEVKAPEPDKVKAPKEEAKSVPESNETVLDEKKEEANKVTEDKPTEKETTNGTAEPAPEDKEKLETVATETPAAKTSTEAASVEKEAPKSAPAPEPKPATESTPEQTDKVPEEVKEKVVTKPEEVKEVHVNGKTTNGDVEINGNGKDEELNDRLAAENGDKVNGANGDSAENGGSPAATEVRTKPLPDAHTEPISAPTEA